MRAEEQNVGKSPEIESTLVVSTGCISQSTAQALDMGEPEDLVIFPKGEYGWWVHVPEDEDFKEGPSTPGDLRPLMEYARSRGCVWLCLDRDSGFVPPGFPEYDW